MPDPAKFAVKLNKATDTNARTFTLLGQRRGSRGSVDGGGKRAMPWCLPEPATATRCSWTPAWFLSDMMIPGSFSQVEEIGPDWTCIIWKERNETIFSPSPGHVSHGAPGPGSSGGESVAYEAFLGEPYLTIRMTTDATTTLFASLQIRSTALVKHGQRSFDDLGAFRFVST